MIERTIVAGLVATTPKHYTTPDGVIITSFRLASATPRFDPVKNGLVENTNWYTVVAQGQLAQNVSGSINKGDRVIATGSLIIRDAFDDGKVSSSVELSAETVAHDLRWGTSTFIRTVLVLKESPLATV